MECGSDRGAKATTATWRKQKQKQGRGRAQDERSAEMTQQCSSQVRRARQNARRPSDYRQITGGGRSRSRSRSTGGRGGSRIRSRSWISPFPYLSIYPSIGSIDRSINPSVHACCLARRPLPRAMFSEAHRVLHRFLCCATSF